MNATKSNFYATGGTLRPDTPSYVERRADAELYDGLTRGEFCYVLTSRQMGKSSLMIRTATRLREEGLAVVVLDLTALGQNLTVEQWYDGLLSQMGRQLGIEDQVEDYWLEHERLGPLQRWMGALHDEVLARSPGRVIIFVDEIDVVRGLPFSTDEFFAAIRECFNRRTQDHTYDRLTFCLLGVAVPSDLIRDTRLTPFNIGRRIELNDFTAVEALPLARGLGCEERIGKALLKRVLHWTGGHPYLTQRLCGAVAHNAGALGPAEVDRQCEALFLSSRARERDDNLLFVRERLLRDGANALDLYDRVRAGRREPDDELDPRVGILRLSGAVTGVGGFLRVRNRIYERVFDRSWVRAMMSDGEAYVRLLRLQQAFRRGVRRAGAIAIMFMAILAWVTSLGVGNYNLAARNRTLAQQEHLRADRAERALREALKQQRLLLDRLDRSTTRRADASPAGPGEIEIELTSEQKERIRRATGLKVSTLKLSSVRVTRLSAGPK